MKDCTALSVLQRRMEMSNENIFSGFQENKIHSAALTRDYEGVMFTDLSVWECVP